VEEKKVLDDSNAFLINDKKLGNLNFFSGWEMASMFRFITVCNLIVKNKWKYFKDTKKIRILDIGSSNANFYRVWSRNYDAMLKFAVDYTGIELDVNTLDKFEIDKARFNKGRDSVELINFNCIEHNLSELNKKYDFIIAMEILEHVGKENAENLMADMRDVLEDNSSIFISSPNPKKLKGQEFVWPETHLYEFTLDEMIGAARDKKLFAINTCGWLGKAKNIKKHLSGDALGIYNRLTNISSGFALSIIAYLLPDLAECYLIEFKKSNTEVI